jgi:ring-1,2-phenylacetyl-CoA epoxidase subunit PaaE
MSVAPPTSAAAPGSAHLHSLRVAEIERLTDDAVAISFDVPGDLRDAYRFTQGQHVAIRCELAGDDVRRNYSICSAATSETLRVAVKLLREGVFSSYALTELKPGDTLEVLPPHGGFFTPLDPGQRKRYVAIAAGSGITPILSLIATTLEVERGSDFTLLYGNRTSRSIMFLEELADLKNRHTERLALHHVLSREARGIELFDGRIDAERLRRFYSTSLLGPGEVDEWFLCGPMAMVDDLIAVLGELGVDLNRVHRELFFTGNGPASPTQPRRGAKSSVGNASQVTIRLDGRESSFELDPSHETILDGALQVRGDAPYACRGGVCATCRAKLLDGEVEMDREYALEQDQKESGYVLTCQARPTTKRVVVDYDT